jgi:hypothetical protein
MSSQSDEERKEPIVTNAEIKDEPVSKEVDDVFTKNLAKKKQERFIKGALRDIGSLVHPARRNAYIKTSFPTR